MKNHTDMLIFHTAVCDEPKQPLIRHACRKHACGDSHKCSSWRINMSRCSKCSCIPDISEIESLGDIPVIIDETKDNCKKEIKKELKKKVGKKIKKKFILTCIM